MTPHGVTYWAQTQTVSSQMGLTVDAFLMNFDRERPFTVVSDDVSGKLDYFIVEYSKSNMWQ